MYDRLTVPTTCLQNTAQVTVWTFGEILVIHAGAKQAERIGSLQNELLARMYDDVKYGRNIFSENV